MASGWVSILVNFLGLCVWFDFGGFWLVWFCFRAYCGGVVCCDCWCLSSCLAYCGLGLGGFVVECGAAFVVWTVQFLAIFWVFRFCVGVVV